MSVMKHWHKLPKEVPDGPSLETFKVRLNRPGAVIEISAHCRWLKLKDLLWSLAIQIILRFYNSKSRT